MLRKAFVSVHDQLCKAYSCVSFDSFMISPVQRIPRYMLYLKDLLKHSFSGNQSH